MERIAARFETFLHGRGLRLTKQRAAILRAMYATHRHVTADQLYELLHRSGAGKALRIGRATVYRTLALLDAGGFVQGLDVGRESGTLYEHTLGHEHHDHMICLQCGRISEFSDSRLEAVQDEAVRRQGFTASSHRLNVYGTCARCSGRRRRGGRAPAAAPGPEAAAP